MPVLNRLVLLAAVCGLAACDSVAPAPASVVGRAHVEASNLAPRADGALLARRDGRTVVAQATEPEHLDLYFDVALDLGGILVVDLLDGTGGPADFRMVQTRTSRNRLVMALDGPGWSEGVDIEYLRDGAVVASATHLGTGPIAESEEETESVHYKTDPDGKIIAVYDFSDGEPSSVTPAGSIESVQVTEIRVRTSKPTRRLSRPTVAFGGTGWETMAFETADARFSR